MTNEADLLAEVRVQLKRVVSARLVEGVNEPKALTLDPNLDVELSSCASEERFEKAREVLSDIEEHP